MNNRSLTSNTLKTIAIIAMFLDHFVAVFIPHDTFLRDVLRIPGCIVAPIMCFMIAEGFHKTSNINKYITRLFVFSVLSHIPYNLCFGYSLSPLTATSVMWSLCLGLAALTFIKSGKSHSFIKLVFLILCCLLAYTANWNYIAVLWIVSFGIFYGDFKKQALFFCVLGAIFYIAPSILRSISNQGVGFRWYQLGILAAIPLLALYKGKRGKKSKFFTWFFYLFYPLHLLLIYFINTFTSFKDFLGEIL